MSDIAFSVLIGNGYDDIIFKTIMIKGDKGNSIASIEKTSTSGKVDTYTITLTDGTIGGTFTVTNGEDGAPVNIDDTVTALDKTWSSSKLSGMIKEIDDTDVDADKLWSSQKISSLIPQTSQIANQPMASFSDGADNVPVSSLIVDIEAYQDGTGDASPTNVRAISGRDAVNLVKCRKNLICGVLEGKGINSSGAISSSSSNNIVYAPVKAGVNYALTSSESSKVYAFFREMPQTSAVSYSGGRSSTSASYVTAEIDGWLAVRVPNTDTQVQIEIGTTPSTYEDFDGGIDTIDLTQTVYGGSVDVVTGMLSVTHRLLTFNKNSTWTINTSGVFYVSVPSGIDDLKMCNYFEVFLPRGSSNAIEDGQCRLNSNRTNINFKILSCETLEDFKTWLGDNTIQVVYSLSTPITVQLTPTEMRTLLGLNNIIADTGDINELVYFKTGSETVARMIEAYLRGE